MTKEDKKSLINLFELLNSKNDDEAFILFNEIKDEQETKSKLGNLYNFLLNYFEEYEFLTQKKSDIKFCNALEFIKTENYKSAYEYFDLLYKDTNNIIFRYYIGFCLYNLGDYDNAYNHLKEYSIHGTYNLQNCLKMLINICNNFLNNSDDIDELQFINQEKENAISKLIFVKQVKSGSSYRKKINKSYVNLDYSKEIDIIELIKFKKINDIVNLFELSDNIRKINILALLYCNGFEKIADKLLKKNKEEIKNTNFEYLDALVKNKKLYLAKAKYGEK